jgi:hypothetical protein
MSIGVAAVRLAQRRNWRRVGWQQKDN